MKIRGETGYGAGTVSHSTNPWRTILRECATLVQPGRLRWWLRFLGDGKLAFE